MHSSFEDAQSSFQSGELRKAESLYTRCIEACHYQDGELSESLRVRLAEAFNNRGQIKYLRVDFDEAVEDYTSALQMHPDFAVAYYNRGQIHYRLARYQEGMKDFQQALRCQPDFQDAEIALQTAREDAEVSQSVATETASN